MWARLGSLKVVCAALIGLQALYMALVAFGNISDFSTNQQLVKHVLAMDSTNFGQPVGVGLDHAVMWRALTAATAQDAVYVLIIVWESATALVLAGALAMWILERRSGRPTARALSTIGLLMILMLFFGAFIDIGGEWYQMWRSTTNNGVEPAFRNTVLSIATLIVIHLPQTPALR